MDLRDYPRPKDDTGIGVHWSAGFPAAAGMTQIRDIWAPELQALGVKWVKIARHDGALELAELLLSHGIMPIMRLYRPQPNPGRLDESLLRAVKDYVAAGVRYFEFNSDPDLAGEWQGGFLPADALAVVAQNAIADSEAILARGGYPGIPAVSPACRWDIVGEICRLGRRDLLAQPVWQAVHNFSFNRPLDYPADAGSREGRPYSADFYGRLAVEAWEGEAWGGWSLERVNQERQERANPTLTAFDDPACWRAYERYDHLIRRQIGRSLPILSTESGPLVGQRTDARYPAVTPQLHMAQTLEACRAMMGASARFDHAPDYYFCTAFWLLGNYTLGNWTPELESQAWYSNRWPGGALPIVAALKAEPKLTRGWRGDAGVAGRVSGAVRGGAGLTVQLLRDDGWALAARVGPQDRYQFSDVPPDLYTVLVGGAGQSETIALSRERPAAIANFDVTGAGQALEASVVRGVVRGGAGLTIRLLRPSDGWTQEQAAAADGAYAFSGLRAGAYTIGLPAVATAQTGLTVDGRGETVIDLAAPGWGWEVADGGLGPGYGVVRCRVTGRVEQAVQLWTAGWEGLVAHTGSQPELGAADVCEFAPLGPGRYSIRPEGLDVTAEILVDGSRVTWVNFVERAAPAAEQAASAATSVPKVVPATRSAEPAPEASALRWWVEDGGPGPGYCVVRCRVNGQPGRAVSLWTWGWGGLTQFTGSQPEQGADVCEFAPLGPGVYFLELEDADPVTGVVNTVRAEVRLETNRVLWVYFAYPGGARGAEAISDALADAPPDAMPELPPTPATVTPAPPGASAIAGMVTNGEGLLLLLTGPAGEDSARVSEGRYRFEHLPAGAYRLAVLAGDVTSEALTVRDGLAVDGRNIVTVDFSLPAQILSESRVAGRVRGGAGRVIVLEGPLTEAIAAEVRTTTVAADETYSFDDLMAGSYRATLRDTEPPTGSGQIHSGIALDGANSVRVDFGLDALGPGKALDHYLLVGSVARSKDDFLTVLRYVARFRPLVGSDEAEARRARHVTILGGVSAVSALAEQGLRLSGCQVQRIDSDFAENLGKLIDEGRAY